MINDICCPQTRRPQTSWNQKVDDADSHLPHHQPIRKMSKSWSRLLWTIIIKTSHYPLQRGIVSGGASLLCSLFAWQRNTATLSLSSKILSLYFCLALVHMEPIFWHHYYSTSIPRVDPKCQWWRPQKMRCKKKGVGWEVWNPSVSLSL